MQAYGDSSRERMTIAKAKLYRTARIAWTDIDKYVFGYANGDVVAVRYMGRGGFGLNFQISYPGRPTVVVVDDKLTDFVL